MDEQMCDAAGMARGGRTGHGNRDRDRATSGAGGVEDGSSVIGLLQRVTEASVSVHGERIAAIGPGLLVLAAVHRDDEARDISRLAERILGYRVFPDADGRMNLSVTDAGLELLLVPQFTLAADTRKGMRASQGRGVLRPPRGPVPRAPWPRRLRALRRRHAGTARQ